MDSTTTDTLRTITAADSVAVAHAVTGAVSWLVSLLLERFQGLDPRVADLIQKSAAIVVVNLVIAGLRLGMVRVGRILGPNSLLVSLWDTHRGWLNIVLAYVLGQIGGGSAAVGAIAASLHAGYRGVAKAAGKATPQGVARSARVLAFVVAFVACAPVARAGVADLLRPATKPIDPPMSAFALQRFAVQLGVGAQANGWVYSRGTTGFVEAQAAYQWTNAIGLRVGVRRETVARAPLKPEARLTLTFAP